MGSVPEDLHIDVATAFIHMRDNTSILRMNSCALNAYYTKVIKGKNHTYTIAPTALKDSVKPMSGQMHIVAQERAQDAQALRDTQALDDDTTGPSSTNSPNLIDR
jgi:hypothetical protein